MGCVKEFIADMMSPLCLSLVVVGELGGRKIGEEAYPTIVSARLGNCSVSIPPRRISRASTAFRCSCRCDMPVHVDPLRQPQG